MRLGFKNCHSGSTQAERYVQCPNGKCKGKVVFEVERNGVTESERESGPGSVVQVRKQSRKKSNNSDSLQPGMGRK